MKNWKILTFVSVAAIVAALLASSAFAAAMMGGGGYGGYGGMMGGGYGYGYGYNNPPYSTGATIPTTPSGQYYQPVYPMMFGGGMMGRFGNGQGFGGMMSGYGYTAPYANTGTPLTITNAVTIAKNYVSSIGNPDLVVKQVEEYSANFYVQVNEKSGNGAFELLINKYTGSIYPEMGPNMMWNIKYGMMRGGILGGIFGTPTTTTMTVTSTQATANAQQYLNTYVSGATTGDVTTFYGYYTIEVLNGGTTYGMLSVNGYTGQVWVHTWHGTFVQEQQVI